MDVDMNDEWRGGHSGTGHIWTCSWSQFVQF